MMLHVIGVSHAVRRGGVLGREHEMGELISDEEMVESARERGTRIWCQDTGIRLSGDREGLLFFQNR